MIKAGATATFHLTMGSVMTECKPGTQFDATGMTTPATVYSAQYNTTERQGII